MKVAFIIIRGNSGSDVYYSLLKKSLDRYTDIQSEIFYLPSRLELFPFLIPRYIRKIDLNGFDVIHTNAEFGHYFTVKGKKLYVTVLHSVFDNTYQKYTSIPQKIFHYLWIKPNLKKTLSKADKIIAISSYTKNQVVEYFKTIKPIQMIHNGIDTDLFMPSPPRNDNNKTRLLFVGNPIKRKGFDLLPGIMERLGPNYELFFTAGLRNIDGEKLPKNMIPLGQLSIEGLIEEYNKCDILLFPSRLEGFGYCICEAMACNKPAVTTDYSSMPELLVNKQGGFLCKMDDINGFVDSINLLAGDKDLCKKMGEFNRERVESLFTLKRMIMNYEKLYKEIMRTA